MARRKTTRKKATRKSTAKKSATKRSAKGKAKKAVRPPKSPQALAKRIQSLRTRRAKAEAQISALAQKIDDCEAQIDALVAATLAG